MGRTKIIVSFFARTIYHKALVWCFKVHKVPIVTIAWCE
jgi:hypothetical protein